jgi:hypothetical protein
MIYTRILWYISLCMYTKVFITIFGQTLFVRFTTQVKLLFFFLSPTDLSFFSGTLSETKVYFAVALLSLDFQIINGFYFRFD